MHPYAQWCDYERAPLQSLIRTTSLMVSPSKKQKEFPTILLQEAEVRLEKLHEFVGVGMGPGADGMLCVWCGVRCVA